MWTAQNCASPEAGAAVGARLVRLDGQKKVDGREIFGADETPVGTLGCASFAARITALVFSSEISMSS